MIKEIKLNWKLLKSLLDEIGIPSFEKNVQELILSHVNPLLYEANFTSLGHLILKSKSRKRKRIVVCSHSDEVGFIIKRITMEGLAEVLPLGGIYTHSVYGAQFTFVNIHNKKLTGVLIHPTRKDAGIISGENQRGVKRFLNIPKNLYNQKITKTIHYIDFGFKSKNDARKAGIRVGCQGTYATKAKKIGNQRILAKAIDNRLGTYLNLMTSFLMNENSNYAIDRIFGAREEIGAVSIDTALANSNYKTAIVIDVSPSREDEGLGKLGDGVLERIVDANHITNRRNLDYFLQIAKKYNIKTQPYVSLGGTDAGIINVHNSGISIFPLAIVARNLHTGNSICDINDVLNANKMLLALLKEINPSWLNSL